MTDRNQMLSIAEQALAASQADQTEAIVLSQNDGLTRFANNAIHQNVHESDATVTLRAVVGKRIGVASTNDISPAALQELAQRALEVARHAAPNDEFVSLPPPSDTRVDSDLAPVPATGEFGPEQRAEAVREMITIAEADSFNAAGQFATGDMAVAVANSLGIASCFHRSSARARVVMQGTDSTGFAEAMDDDVGSISAEALATTAAEKALSSAAPRDLDPGEYTVILEPLAVADMISMLAIYDLHALAHQEGRSFTSTRMGERVCGDNISLWDDGADPRGTRMPVDFEGVPKQRVDIIERGVLKAVTYDSFTAGREPGAKNTGHALPPPNTWGPVPLNLFMNTGEHTIEDMIRATERGVLVTRFHYTNMVHPVRTVFTGMTRDGTFLIEGGEIVGGIKNLRFTQSILEALSNVDMIGEDGAQSGHAWAPAIRVQGFGFTSATSF